MYTVEYIQHINQLKFKISIILKFYLFVFFGSMALFFFGKFASYIISTIFSVSLIKDLPSSSSAIERYGELTAFVILVLKAPLIEEFIFRYWVVYNKRNLFISIFSLIPILLSLFTDFFSYKNPIIFPILLIVYDLMLYFLLNKKSDNMVYSYSNLFVFISGILFGLSHLMNYNLSKYGWFICLPYILPQIFSGIIFGHLRLKYGLWYGISVHSLLNLSAFLAGLV